MHDMTKKLFDEYFIRCENQNQTMNIYEMTKICSIPQNISENMFCKKFPNPYSESQKH